jgi:hypothetical protein
MMAFKYLTIRKEKWLNNDFDQTLVWVKVMAFSYSINLKAWKHKQTDRHTD